MNTISTEVRMLANWLLCSQLGAWQGNEYHYSAFAEVRTLAIRGVAGQ